jgi:hypothetical protein
MDMIYKVKNYKDKASNLSLKFGREIKSSVFIEEGDDLIIITGLNGVHLKGLIDHERQVVLIFSLFLSICTFAEIFILFDDEEALVLFPGDYFKFYGTLDAKKILAIKDELFNITTLIVSGKKNLEQIMKEVKKFIDLEYVSDTIRRLISLEQTMVNVVGLVDLNCHIKRHLDKVYLLISNGEMAQQIRINNKLTFLAGISFGKQLVDDINSYLESPPLEELN